MAENTSSRFESLKGARAESPPERVLVGRVTRPHGLRGAVKVDVHSDVPERFDVGAELWLAATGSRRVVRIRDSRFVPGGAVLAFEGIEHRDQAEELRGAELEVDRDRVPPAPEGFFYFFDLVGCRCFDKERGDLGEVVDLIEDGGGILLRVAFDQRQLLVPFVEAFLENVNIEERRIDLSLPAGLIETCASES